GRLIERQSRAKGHCKRQVLTEYEEKSIVRWCERLEEWCHPARLNVVKGIAEAMIARRVKEGTLGKHWVKSFLPCYPTLAAKLGTRLDRQGAHAGNPVVWKDYFNRVQGDSIINHFSG
ncbi:hypothetical protein HOY82DRAFT_479212, partial [Tuber indicum]